MTVTAASVKAIATELSSVDDAVFDPLIAMAERRTNRDAWGERADDGVIFLVAHMVTVQQQAAAGRRPTGPLVSETVGPLSRSYAAPAPAAFSQAWFGLSTWGQAYAELRSLVFADRVGED